MLVGGSSQVALLGEGLLLVKGGAAVAQDGRVRFQGRLNPRFRLFARREVRRRGLLHL